MKKRWYDKDKRLAKQLDAFMKVHPKYRYTIIQGILDIIKHSDQDILNRFVVPSDIEKWSRRWYDDEPMFWLVINSLKYAKEKLLKEVASYMEEQMQLIVK